MSSQLQLSSRAPRSLDLLLAYGSLLTVGVFKTCVNPTCSRNDTVNELAGFSRSGLLSCENFERYKVAWSHNDLGSLSPVLTMSELDKGTGNWATIIAARYDTMVPLQNLGFCNVSALKYPLITSKLPDKPLTGGRFSVYYSCNFNDQVKHF